MFLASNGVVVATENKRKSLLYETTVEKVQKITPNIGMVYSGTYEHYINLIELLFQQIWVKITVKICFFFYIIDIIFFI